MPAMPTQLAYKRKPLSFYPGYGAFALDRRAGERGLINPGYAGIDKVITRYASSFYMPAPLAYAGI